ncbi:MAG: radical SAM protein [Archaeoglobaceae archaeon]
MFERFFRLGFLQVEVSTKCQLSCVMCPKSFFEWESKNMDFELFKKLPFSSFRYAHLQGWGEPLLNPEIGEMINFACKKCKVGLTTNGLLINEWIEDLAKLDLIAISIAGIEAQGKIRGAKLQKIAENITLLTARKKRPRIVIATLMMKRAVEELPQLVQFASSVGADEVVANNLDYIPSKELMGEEVFSEVVDSSVAQKIRIAEMKAKEVGIGFTPRPIKLEEALICAENPLKNCFITVDGLIAPCAYLHLPTKSDEIIRFFKGKEVKIGKLYFGRAENFKEVWRSKEYSEFRKIYEKRLSECFIPDLPEVCRTCYKAYSV